MRADFWVLIVAGSALLAYIVRDWRQLAQAKPASTVSSAANEGNDADMPAEAPEQALWHAQFLVSAMKANEGVTLDFSPDSLRHLDALLKNFHENGITVDRVPKTLFEIGCYAGQVVVNACPGSKWMHAQDFDPPLDSTEFPDSVIFHPNGKVIWAPIARAVKVLRDPESNSLLVTCLDEIQLNGPAGRQSRSHGAT